MTTVSRLALFAALALSPLAFAQDAAPQAEQPVTPAVDHSAAEQTEQAEQPEVVPEPEPPKPQRVLRELLVLQADRYGDTANDPTYLATTLFKEVTDRGRDKRIAANGGYDHSPMPLGLIALSGPFDEPISMRLSLPYRRDQFHAHWPSGIEGSRSLHWPAITVAEESDRVVPTTQYQDWLSPLRGGEDRLWLRSRGEPYKERFLLYDASFKFEPAIQLGQANGQYTLSNQTPEDQAPPVTVLLRRAEAGWYADMLTAPWGRDPAPFGSGQTQAATAVPLDQALAPIANLLTERGYNAQEIALAMQMIASAGPDTAKMCLVYILPDGVIDKHIRLTVKPEPDQLIRTAVVVVNNVDPDLGTRVNALLDALGSEQWAQRDRAQRDLIALGQAAIDKVRRLTNSQDPEVAFRAQQILDAYDRTHSKR